VLSGSVFRYMLMKGLLEGKSIIDVMYNGTCVKYFSERKIGSRSELHYMKRVHTKKSVGILRSTELEKVLEKQLLARPQNEDDFDFSLYVAFANPKFDDELKEASDVLGDENDNFTIEDHTWCGLQERVGWKCRSNIKVARSVIQQ